MELKEFTQLLMSELKELSSDIKHVRQEDIPGIHIQIARLESQLSVLKEEVSKEADRKAKIYGGVGGVMATVVALLMRYVK